MDGSVIYNVRRKVYVDGTEQFMFFERPKEKGYTVEEKEKTGDSVKRKEADNAKRAMQIVYDIARSNKWDWFITLTFDPFKVDSMDYLACVQAMKCFTQVLQKSGFVYLLVPEQHKSGAYHFHGLVKGRLPVVPARNPEGHLIVDDTGRQVYNISIYDYGFTTATAIDDQAKAAGYVAKYLTKELTVPKGKKRYWASRSCQRPKEEFGEMTLAEYGEVFNESHYQKVIESPYGRFILCERRRSSQIQE